MFGIFINHFLHDNIFAAVTWVYTQPMLVQYWQRFLFGTDLKWQEWNGIFSKLFLDFVSSGCLLDAQIHNASQLEAWCIHFIATHYNAICRQCPKPLRNLDSSTLKAIETKRWPPPWYILEADWYEKAKQELANQAAAEKLRKSHKHVRHKRKCSCLWASHGMTIDVVSGQQNQVQLLVFSRDVPVELRKYFSILILSSLLACCITCEC